MLILKNKRVSLFGLAGLFGLFGFRYFFTGVPGDLFAFIFFAFFSFFIVGGLNTDTPDERWRENSHKACTAGFLVAACSVFLVGFIATRAVPVEALILGSALGWVAAFFSYALAFLYFEKV